MSEVLDILLAGTARNVQAEPRTMEVRMVRLSKELGRDVVFRLRGLTYQQADELRADNETEIKSVLYGVSEPDFGDVRLAQHYGILKPGEGWGVHGVKRTDLIRAMLEPGEIKELSLRIETLSGFRSATTQEIKKN